MRWLSRKQPADPCTPAGDWNGLWPSLTVLAVLVGIDVLLRGDAIPTSYAVPPFIAAVRGGRWAALITGVLAVVLAVLSGAWDATAGDDAYFARLAIVAAASAIAAVGARAVAESRGRVDRYALLNDVASVADGSAPLPETMRLISDLIVPRLADCCMLDVVADGRVERVAVRASGPDCERIENTLMGRAPSLPDQILETEGPAVIEPRFWERVNDGHMRSIAHDEADFEFIRGLGLRSVIQVGLTSRGRRVAAMTLLAAWSSRRFREEDVRFATVLGDRVALALDNAGLFSDLQSIERRMDSVMDVLDESVLIFGRSRRLVFANDAAARMLEFGTAKELLAAPEGAVRERFDLYDEAGAPLWPDDFSPFRALRGEPCAPQIIRAISREHGREMWLRVKSRVVERVDGEPLYAVTALEDVSEMKESEFEQTLLARLGELFDSALNYEEMAQRMADLLIPQLADWCTIYAARPDRTIEHVASAHADPERLRKARHLDAEYPPSMGDAAGPAEVIRSGEPVVHSDLEQMIRALARDEHHLGLMRELGRGSAMLLPMRMAGAIAGVLVLANQADRRPFDDFDRSLGLKVAERGALALENARMATERSEIARTLQAGLLPAPLPHIPGWSVAAFYRPAGSENEVGGDFYDAFLFRGGWMLVVGDVTGRGATAASITGLARTTLRTASALSGDPLVALAALNRALITRAGSALCTVAAIAVKEDRDSEVEIAVAGHPPPLLVDAAGVRPSAGTGPVLGAFPEAEWELGRTRLEPGSQLVVYTDGVTEACGTEGRFGEERLRGRLLGASSPVVAVQRIEEALDSFCLGNVADDAAILALARADLPASEGDPDSLIAGTQA
jgi:GAF domain-containing protein